MIKRIKLDQYECKVTVETVADVSKRLTQLYKKFKVSEDAGTGYDGVAFNATLQDYYVIYEEKELSHNLIAHELFHISNRICKDREIEDEEAGAWLIGYLTGTTYKALHKANIPIKNG